MRNVAAGTLIAVRITTSGRVLVSLVGLRHIKQPQPESKPLFRGSTEEKLSFRVTAPEADDYVLVLSNRGGSQDVSVQAEIQAVRRAPRPPPKDRAPRHEKAGHLSYHS